MGSGGTVRQAKLPGLQPGPQAVRLKQTENGLQEAIMQALTLLGYTVLSTSEHRKGQTCPKCGSWQVLAGGRGTSKAVPDLLVRRREWPAGVLKGLEVKVPGGRVSPEQQALADADGIIIVRSIEDAIQAAEMRG